MISRLSLSPTLTRYLARLFLRNMLVMGFLLIGIVYLFDVVELLRRAAKGGDVSFGVVLTMALYKAPMMAETIAPFVMLFSALFTFWSLGRRQELTALRAAGVSAWQFLAPIMGVALCAGILIVAVLNPIGAIFVGKYNSLEDVHLERKSLVAVFEEGLWLRQETEMPGAPAETKSDRGYAILHADKIDMPAWRLNRVMALYFTKGDQFVQRIDARSARLTDGAWRFDDAIVTTPKGGSRPETRVDLPTQLTAQDIEESFAPPDSMGFWSLPSFIKTLDVTGFDSTRLRIHFQKLIATPFLFVAMILLAAAVGLRPPRHHGTFGLIVFGVVVGFLVFFVASFLQALGTTHQLPVFLAAWAPALITLLLGTTVLMMVEDG